MPLLPSILTPSSRTQQPFVLLQSSTVTSCLPIIRSLTCSIPSKTLLKRHIILFSFLYPPERLVNLPHLQPQGVELQIHDWTDRVLGYSDDVFPKGIAEDVMKIVDIVPKDEPFDVVIDSADTLLDTIPSVSKVYNLLFEVLSKVKAGASTSRLIVHIHAPSPLIPLLSQTRFSSSLTHLIAHPPILLTHLSTSYFTPPPPLSPPEKFWSVFTPISERLYESEKLVFGSEGEGHAGNDIVVEVIIRGGGSEGGRKRGVEKVLEGWIGEQGRPCELSVLESLKNVFMRKTVMEEAAPDPTQNVSFNLHLTPDQERSRAQVPLPYAHEGQGIQVPVQTPGAILYDPDSADDIDDDDPDEDLDI
ncbi:hypothetical protein QCA50_001787 [Cerrena zonata]|uniref:Elongator complex protein 5 n=1 Tax=Cerrena zonata TaxID=2478898 RepID=A0AAW0GPC3_9APHY